MQLARRVRLVNAALAVALAAAASAAGDARGEEPVWTIVAPAKVRPGSVARVDLVGLNPHFAEVMRLDAPPVLTAAFSTATASFPVTLAATSDSPLIVEPRGFAARTYSMTVPDAPDGEATLVVTAGDREIGAAMRVARDGARGAREPLPSSPALAAFPRTLSGRLSTHLPNYFIYGAGNEPAAKFQLSFKYRVLTFGDASADRPRPSLQLAYTQRSLWDVRQRSAPFYDASYMPEVFVEWSKPASDVGSWFSFLGWASGYRHESNGRDGDDSRSVDVVYARAHFAAGSPRAWYAVVAPEIWQHVARGRRNSDVEDYRGHGRLYLVVGHGAGPSVLWTVTPEHGLDHLTHQLDLSIPIGVRRLDLATYVQVQYFDGYAESLRDYTHESRSLRVGFALVR
jgi:outer membrane phospholipase A